MTKNVVVVGTQWGDEGKGKIVDLLTEQVSGVVRFQGGHNAGHTLVIKGQSHVDAHKAHSKYQIIVIINRNEISNRFIHPKVSYPIQDVVQLDDKWGQCNDEKSNCHPTSGCRDVNQTIHPSNKQHYEDKAKWPLFSTSDVDNRQCNLDKTT